MYNSKATDLTLLHGEVYKKHYEEQVEAVERDRHTYDSVCLYEYEEMLQDSHVERPVKIINQGERCRSFDAH